MSYLIGNKLKNLRDNKGLTQKELANKIKVSLITIQRWEGNKKSPPFNKVQKILEILNANLFDIMEPREKYEQIKSTEEIIEIANDSLLFAGIKKGDKLIFDTLINSIDSTNDKAFFVIKAENKTFIGIPKITPGGVLIFHAGDPFKYEIKIFPKSKIEVLGKITKLIRNF